MPNSTPPSPKSFTTLGQLKAHLSRHRAKNCECCGQEKWVHAAHIFFGTDKRYEDWLRRGENIALLCLTCHGQQGGDALSMWWKVGDTDEFRERWMPIQMKRYDMEKWLKSIPEPKKRGFEWKRSWMILKNVQSAE